MTELARRLLASGGVLWAVGVLPQAILGSVPQREDPNLVYALALSLGFALPAILITWFLLFVRRHREAGGFWPAALIGLALLALVSYGKARVEAERTNVSRVAIGGAS